VIERLPLFTYGTLKPTNKGSLIYGLTEGALDGYLEGFELRDAGRYPIAIPSPKEIVWGTIAWLNLSQYDRILEALDGYEGQGFKRSIVEAAVSEDSCPVQCWLYSCSETNLHNTRSHPKVAGGFWSK
jgi:gamma-glutamylcyclotransferase (GGCT)/AIG2-like uncharacterized protein YtfP